MGGKLLISVHGRCYDCDVEIVRLYEKRITEEFDLQATTKQTKPKNNHEHLIKKPSWRSARSNENG